MIVCDSVNEMNRPQKTQKSQKRASLQLFAIAAKKGFGAG
jgi:hypothetical protein